MPGGRYIERGEADVTWIEFAACKGAPIEWFYPESRLAYNAEARRMCAGCPVQEPCLDYAVDNYEMFGFWGGKSNMQRRVIRRRRLAVRQAQSDPYRKSIG